MADERARALPDPARAADRRQTVDPRQKMREALPPLAAREADIVSDNG